MKKLSITLFVLFISLAASAQSKIGTIDAEYILAQMPESLEINTSMETYNKELQTELETAVNEYETLVKDYQSTVETMEDAAKKEKETKLMELENDIKNFRQRATVMMQMKRNELTSPLYVKIDEAMNKVIAAEGYTQIFHTGGNALAFSRVEDDITDKVMKELGVTPRPMPEQTAENK